MRVSSLIGVVCLLAAVAVAGDPPDLEPTMAFSLSESRFVVKDVPLTASREEVVEYVTAALDEQFDELKKGFLDNVAATILEGDTEVANARRCHVEYDINGNILWCDGNPYDCLCIYVFAPSS